MMTKPTLSVLVLTKNRERLLNECLRSLAGQLSGGDEIIIVDNGSTDNTKHIIAKHARTMPIKMFYTCKKGYANLYNYAIAKSTKKILIFLDDDCIADPLFIKTTRRIHEQHKNSVVQGKTYSLPKNNLLAEISEDHLNDWIEANKTNDNRLRIIDNRNASLPRKMALRFHGFSRKMSQGSEDVELGLRLYDAEIPIFYCPSVVVHHQERLSLSGFLQQHLRIAASHAIFDSFTASRNTIGMLNSKTYPSHIRGAFRRMKRYGKQGRIKDFFSLPVVYLLLVVVRLYGYVYGTTHRSKI